MIRAQVLKHFPGEKEAGAKEMLEVKWLPKDQWKRVAMLGSLRERRSEEITQLNTSSPRMLRAPFQPQNE